LQKKGTSGEILRFTIDTFVGIEQIVNYYDKFPPQTVKHRVRFVRVKKLLPYALNGTWKSYLPQIRNMIKLNARMYNRS
jgi:hypothetical protein